MDASTWPAGPAGWFLRTVIDNLEALSDVMGLRLQLSLDAEQLGPDAAVIEDAEGRDVVVIAEPGPGTDQALGLLLRQMVSSGRRAAVWLTTETRPEHLASISWLNDTLDGSVFVTRVNSVEIGRRPAALIFSAALRPPARQRGSDTGTG